MVVSKSSRFVKPKSLLVVVMLVLLTQWSFAGVRMGGGRAMGHQHSSGASGAKGSPSSSTSGSSSNVSNSPSGPSGPSGTSSVAPAGAAPGAPVGTPSGASRPSQSPSSAPAPAPGPSPSVAPAATSSFGGLASRMLMGAALGFGVVSLAHALGLGPDHAQSFMLLVLLILIGIVAYVAWRYAFGRPSRYSDAQQLHPMGSQGVGAGQGNPVSAALGRTYNPKNVGNDASARPWESQGTLFTDRTSHQEEHSLRAVQKPFEPQQLGLWDSPSNTASSSTPTVNLPDVEHFKSMAKDHFLQLQDAWDHLDIDRLSSFLSLEMLTLVKNQLAQLGLKPQKTEVMMLQAQWLGFESVGQQLIASVELSGMSREAQEASFSPFREIWSWTRPIADENAAWLVCGLEPLQ